MLISGVIVSLVAVNAFGGSLVVRTENVFNIVKLLILAGFIVAGLTTPMDWSRLGTENYVSPMGLVAGAMLIFLNYEGFELIANASKDVANVRLARETDSRAWLSALAALSTAVALVVLCVEVEENPATRNHLWILVGMIVVTLAIEIAYRGVTGRKMRLEKDADACVETDVTDHGPGGK